MGRYWIRQRLLPSLILTAMIAFITGFLFVYPFIEQCANSYNARSIYKNSGIDFVAPEPSFDQVSDLPGTQGIEKVFPFYLTKTEVTVNGKSRTTTVLLSDQFTNVDMTMYNEKRLLQKSDGTVDNPILVDWQFCHDTSADVGDKVSFLLGGKNVEFTIAAIYETNTIYDGGAVLAEISAKQKDAIAKNARSNGYSGMYVSASDYSICRTYLTTDYRPLGRLKDRDQFDSDEQYQVHYDAVMSSGYANEITDFRVRENDLENTHNPLMVVIGVLLAATIIIVFNVVMANRNCEKGFFKKNCIPKGQNVKPYYTVSFIFEMVVSIALFAGVLVLKTKTAKEYVPNSAHGVWVALVPAAIVVAEIIALIMNNSKVAGIAENIKADQEAKAKVETETRGRANTGNN